MLDKLTTKERNKNGAHNISPAAHTYASDLGVMLRRRRADSVPKNTPIKPARQVMAPKMMATSLKYK